MKIYCEDDLPSPVGDHFDGLSDALRAAEKHGVNSGVVVISALQSLAGETNLSSQHIVCHITGTAWALITEKVHSDRSERAAREYMDEFAGYVGTLPQAVQNDMRQALVARFKAIIQGQTLHK